MKIHARPNINGNPAKDFSIVAVELYQAVNKVSHALSMAETNVLHGRNYQTVSEPNVSKSRDRELMDQAYDAVGILKNLSLAIHNASEGESR